MNCLIRCNKRLRLWRQFLLGHRLAVLVVHHALIEHTLTVAHFFTLAV